MANKYTLGDTTLALEDTKEKEHPQRDLMKKICNLLFYLGAGNFWYEDRKLSRVQQMLYNIYAVILNLYIFGNCINQHSAFLRELTPKEKADAIQFSIAHVHLCSKFVTCYLARKRIKEFLKRLLQEKREFAVLEIDLDSVMIAKRYILYLTSTLVMCLGLGFLDGVLVHIKIGIPIRTEVVRYPTPANSGLFINIWRTVIELHWWTIISLMIAVDALGSCSLVFVGHKFRTLKTYFTGLGEKYSQRHGEDLDVLEKDFCKDFIAGIEFHKETLWCQRNLQTALGTTYSIQITESLILFSYTMIKLVTTERSLTTLLASLSYILCLAVITGLYMLAGGDIIIESEKVPMAIFHSGWEFTRGSRRMRALVVVTLIQSQVPIFMTAFGIIILSYDNFILILKNSYSFFAVMY